jgi:hypothetical protein
MSLDNAIVAVPYVPAAVSTSSALNATTPIANIIDEFPRRLVEATASQLVVDIDLGAALPVNLIAGLFTNAAADTTWTIRAADTQGELASGTLIVDGESFYASASSANAEKPHSLWVGSAVTKRWWRVTIVVGSASPFRIGCLVLGNGLQPYWNYSLPTRVQPADKIQRDQSESGREVVSVSATGRRLAVRFAELSEAEYFGYMAPINRAAAKRKGLIVLRPRS